MCMLSTPQMSTSQALDIKSSLIMLITVQGTTPRFSSIEVQHWIALMRDSRLFHPAVDHGAELGHLDQRGLGHIVCGDVLLDGLQFCLRGIVRVFHAFDAANHLGKVQRLDGNALRFKDAFAVAYRVECRGARADSADAQIPQALHDSANGAKPLKVFLELIRVGRAGVRGGQRVRNPVLPQIVAGGHLAAEAVATVGNRHLRWRVGSGLDQHRNPKGGQSNCVSNRALVAEIRQRDDDSVNRIRVRAEELGAPFGLFVGLNGAVGALADLQRHDIHARVLQGLDHVFPAHFRQMPGKESPVSYDQTHRHLLLV